MQARAPDGRLWTVRRIWWPRATQVRLQSGVAAGGATRYGALGVPIALVFYLAVVAAWPLVMLIRLAFRGRWRVEAVPENNLGVEGVAWRIRGWRNSAAAVEEIAQAIEAHRKPQLRDAKVVEFEKHPPTPTHGIGWR